MISGGCHLLFSNYGKVDDVPFWVIMMTKTFCFDETIAPPGGENSKSLVKS